jgi:hypothetical protein
MPGPRPSGSWWWNAAAEWADERIEDRRKAAATGFYTDTTVCIGCKGLETWARARCKQFLGILLLTPAGRYGQLSTDSKTRVPSVKVESLHCA